MAQPDPWLEHYGERRGAARAPAGCRSCSRWLRCSRSRSRRCCSLLAGTLGWRPPSGLDAFRACTYGGRVEARCAGVAGLHVAVIPATRQPARGALFYLEGGPGGAATAAAVSVDEVFAKVSEFRDIVLVDQRGTGGSQGVACPQEHVRATDARAVASYLRRCFARLGRPARSIHDRDRRGRSRTCSAAARLWPDRRLRQLLRRDARAGLSAPLPPLGAHSDARRSIAHEHARVRARGPQCGAGVAGADRPLPRAVGLPAGLSRHPSGARPRAGAAPAHGRRPRDGGRRAAALTRGRRARAPARARGGRGRRGAAGPRIRDPRGHGARRPLSPADVLGHDLQRALGALRRRRHGACEPRKLPVACRRGTREAVPAGLRRRAPNRQRGRAARSEAVARAGPDARGRRRSTGSAGESGRLARHCSPTAGSSRVPGLAHGVIAYGCLRLVGRPLRGPRQHPRAGHELRAASCGCRASSSASRVRGAHRARDDGAADAGGRESRARRARRARRRPRRRGALRGRRRRRPPARRRSRRGRRRARRRRCRTPNPAARNVLLAPEALPMCSGSADPSAAEATLGSTSAIPRPIATSGATSSA